MKRKKRTVIEVEIDQTLILRRQVAQTRAYCTACSAEVPTVTPDDAAVLAFTDAQTIHRWVAEKRIHFAEPRAGRLRLCLPALLACGSDALRARKAQDAPLVKS